MHIFDGSQIENIIDANIFDLLGLQNAPQDKKSQMMSDMMRTIQNRVLARILDKLDQTELAEFERLVDSQNQEAMSQFLQNHSIDITQITAEEALNYKAELVVKLAQPKSK